MKQYSEGFSDFFLGCKLLSLVLFGFLKSLLQKADVGGCGRVLEACREAESGSFLLWLHGSLVQEEVGVDVVELKIQKSLRRASRGSWRITDDLPLVQLTTVPLGSATIISTGKLYFSRWSRAFSLNERFCSSAYWIEKCIWNDWCADVLTRWSRSWAAAQLTCMFSSSFTRDQLLMKLWLSKARTGELSRTVSRRVRPEPREACKRKDTAV